MARLTKAENPSESGVSRLRQRPLDRDHLARQTLGDPGIEAEVLRMFGPRLHAYYERLETSTDTEGLLAHLHAITGASAGVGAWGIADLARVTEAELRNGQPVNPERIDDIGLAIEEVCTAIDSILAEYESSRAQR